MKSILNIVFLLLIVNNVFSQEAPKLKVESKKGMELALKVHPLCLLYSPSQYINLNLEGAFNALPHTSFNLSFAKNATTGINFVERDIYTPIALIPTYTYKSAILKNKPGYTYSIGGRYYLPIGVPANHSNMEGISIGIFASKHSSSLYIQEWKYTTSAGFNGTNYLKEGNQSIQQNSSVIGAEIGYQRALGRKKRFLINLTAAYGQRTNNFTLSQASFIGPGLAQIFETEKSFFFSEGLSIGILLK